MKEEFIRKYNAHIQRDGADKLLSWLEKSDFFEAPASTRFHGAHPGGLVEHSLNVCSRLDRLLEDEYGDESPYSQEAVSLCGLLHDICKVNYYTVSTRNVKNEKTGQWEKQPFYTVDDQLPFGHGEKSVYIINGFVKLAREEAMAIRWHMGGFDDSAKGGSFALSAAFEKYPLALFLHLADMQATYLDEVKKDADQDG